jgi:hypothetical protein
MVVPFGTLSPAVTAQDVADALVQAVAAVAPDAQWPPDGQPRVVASPTAEEGAGGRFGGAGNLTRQGISRRVAVTIGTNGDALVCSTGIQTTCVPGMSPKGGSMVTRRLWDFRYPDWTTTWRVSLALADGLVLEVYSYASKQVADGPLGPVLSETETVAVLDDIASRLTRGR